MLPRYVPLFLLMCSCLLVNQAQSEDEELVQELDDILNAEEKPTDFEQELDDILNADENSLDEKEEKPTDFEQELDDIFKSDESKTNIVESNAITDCVNKVDTHKETINKLVDKFVYKKPSVASVENLKEKINSNIETIIKSLEDCYKGYKFPETSTISTSTTTTTPKPTTTSTTTENPIRSCGPNQECVQLGKCSTSEINENGKYVISVDFPNEDCHYLETCCDKSDIRSVDKVCSGEPDTFSNGVSNPSGICMSLEGERRGVANFGQFPWAVSIWTTEPEEYFNGGSLIRPNVVLTTFNLFKTKNSTYKVRAGDWDLATTNEVLMYYERTVEEIIHYQDFSLVNFANNIALLILKDKFSPLAHIKPIDLPVNIELDYNNCIVTGWEGMQRSRWLLKSMKVEVENCVGANVDDSFMCVWHMTSELRYSLGSPLVCPKLDGNPNKYYQCGAWSDGTSKHDIRFVNISKQIDWINKKLRKHS